MENLYLMYSFICLATVSEVVLWNFMELRNKKAIDENDANTQGQVPDEEAQPPVDSDATNDGSVAPPPSKRNKKDGSSSKSIPLCRFCKQVFNTPQALGGHMNRHRGVASRTAPPATASLRAPELEKVKEEFQKAELLLHQKAQNYTFRYPCEGSAPSYYQQGGSSGNHYPGGGGPHMMMGNMGTPPRQQMCQNPNHHYVSAASASAEPQMNPSYHGPPQQQANYQPHNPQQGGSYNYNPYENNAPRQPMPPPPPQNPTGEPQTSYCVNSGQHYPAHASTSFQDPTPYSQDPTAYTMPSGGAGPAAAPQHQNHAAGTFSGHHVSSAPGLDARTTPDTMAATSHSMHQSINTMATDPAVSAQFVDHSGHLRTQAPPPSSSGSEFYSTGLRRLNPSHFVGTTIHDVNHNAQGRYEEPHVFSQPAPYHDPCGVHGASNCGPSCECDAADGGRENHYTGEDVPNFAGMNVFGNKGADDDLSSMGLMELDRRGGAGRSADARTHH